MKARFSVSATALAVAALLASAAFAQDKAAASKGKKPAGPPDEKAAMEAMMKAGTPGEAHKMMDSSIGTFDAKVTMWMDPSKPPQESTGTAERKWVLGNRYVEEHFEGTMMGQPFTGLGYTGYDNIKKKYVGTWMDSMSTAIMTSTGTMDKAGNMTMSSTMEDPMTGKPQKLTMKVHPTDNDHATFEMWGAGPDGKQMKMMEIQYTRKK